MREDKVELLTTTNPEVGYTFHLIYVLADKESIALTE